MIVFKLSMRLFRTLLLTIAVMISGNIIAQDTNTVGDIDQIISGVELQYRKMSENIPDPANYPRTTNPDGTLRLVGSEGLDKRVLPGITMAPV